MNEYYCLGHPLLDVEFTRLSTALDHGGDFAGQLRGVKRSDTIDGTRSMVMVI
jgi:hypothetical protein